MSNPQLELADVVRRFMGPYQEQFGDCMLPSHRRALQDIAQCMTEAMGGEHYHCQECHESFWIYHGCRNRSCPKCHGRQISAWLKARSVEILPCRYFHLIATVPSQLRSLFLRHQKILYGLLMKIAAETVRDLAAQKRFVGAEVGILAVLHTWTGQLHHHPHVHMLVTGGGVTADGTAWHDAPKDFLVPVRKLSPMIAKRFAAALEKMHPELFAQIPAAVWRREWCSYCKPYGEGQDAVLNYLARYVFRVALTNHRLVAMDDTHVTFRYKDPKTGQWRTERLEAFSSYGASSFMYCPKASTRYGITVSGIPANGTVKPGHVCCWSWPRPLPVRTLWYSWLISLTKRSGKGNRHRKTTPSNAQRVAASTYAGSILSAGVIRCLANKPWAGSEKWLAACPAIHLESKMA